MGETKNTSVLYLDGKPICLNNMPEITFDSYVGEKDTIGTLLHDRSCSFTATFKYIKMSRKKFVHNLIKQGYSKKNAKWLAWYCQKKKIPYSRANTLIIFGLPVR